MTSNLGGVPANLGGMCPQRSHHRASGHTPEVAATSPSRSPDPPVGCIRNPFGSSYQSQRLVPSTHASECALGAMNIDHVAPDAAMQPENLFFDAPAGDDDGRPQRQPRTRACPLCGVFVKETSLFIHKWCAVAFALAGDLEPPIGVEFPVFVCNPVLKVHALAGG